MAASNVFLQKLKQKARLIQVKNKKKEIKKNWKKFTETRLITTVLMTQGSQPNFFNTSGILSDIHLCLYLYIRHNEILIEITVRPWNVLGFS